MLRTAAIATSALFLLAAGSASATDKSKKDPDEVVCKQEKRTGTRFATRICYTRAQWEAIAEANKREFAESRDRPTISTARDN